MKLAAGFYCGVAPCPFPLEIRSEVHPNPEINPFRWRVWFLNVVWQQNYQIVPTRSAARQLPSLSGNWRPRKRTATEQSPAPEGKRAFTCKGSSAGKIPYGRPRVRRDAIINPGRRFR